LWNENKCRQKIEDGYAPAPDDWTPEDEAYHQAEISELLKEEEEKMERDASIKIGDVKTGLNAGQFTSKCKVAGFTSTEFLPEFEVKRDTIIMPRIITLVV